MKHMTTLITILCLGASAQELGFDLAPELHALKRAHPEAHRILADGTYDTMSLDERAAFVMSIGTSRTPELDRSLEQQAAEGMEKAIKVFGLSGDVAARLRVEHLVETERVMGKSLLDSLRAHELILRRLESSGGRMSLQEAMDDLDVIRHLMVPQGAENDMEALWGRETQRH